MKFRLIQVNSLNRSKFYPHTHR